MGLSGRFVKLIGIAALVAAPVVIVSSADAGAEPTQVTFTSVGASSWTVPGGTSCVTVDAIGATGGTSELGLSAGAVTANGAGNVSAQDNPGGLGGEAVSTIPVLAGQSLQVNVGGRGGDATNSGSLPAPGGAGGSNGGAVGGSPTQPDSRYSPGAGGGGASDVRQAGTSLADRVVIGGGGGGGGGFEGGPGGAGGGTTGGDGSGPGSAVGGKGGTQSAGGAGGVSSGDAATGADGSLGSGGAGAGTVALNGGGGGGGGGYYGGGGGGGVISGRGAAASGGGGSGLGDTLTSGVDAGNGGDGKVTLSYTPGDTSCLDAPLTIQKVTTGATPAAGTTFTVHLACSEGNIDIRPFGPSASPTDQDFTFTVDGSGAVQPAGGYVVGFDDAGPCTVTETNAGGAISTTYACAGTPGAAPASTGARGDGWVTGQATNALPLCSAAGPQATPITVGIDQPDQTVSVTVTNGIVAPAAAVTILPKFTG